VSEWPVRLIVPPQRGVISVTQSLGQPVGMISRFFMGPPSAAAWPAANRALYLPFLIEQPCVCTQLWFYMGAQAGNYDMGIYDATKKRLVSMGSTTVPANTNSMALANIADTALSPGHYWLGIVMSTVTTLTVFRYATNLLLAQSIGVQQEALGSTVLPDPPTFANPANSFTPVCGLLLDKTL
jgi:hypothetical protein